MNLPILERVLRDLFKKKTVVFIIFLQLFLVLSLGVVLKNINVLFEPKNVLVRPLPVGVVGSPLVAERIDNERAIFIHHYSNRELAHAAFLEGKIDAYLIEDTSRLPHILEIVVPKNDIRASILLSIMKPHLEMYEDVLRKQHAPQKEAIALSSIRLNRFPDASATKIFEILYAIVVPFFLLLPGILLSSMIIDILIEDIDKKTIPLVLMRISASRYISELGIGVVVFTLIQVLLWMGLLALRKVILLGVWQILLLSILWSVIFFLLAALTSLLFPNKTKSQLIYSFLMIFLFSSLGVSEFHPLRLITSFALGLPTPPLAVVLMLHGGLLFVLAVLTTHFSRRLLQHTNKIG